jgi:hypothetical protein
MKLDHDPMADCGLKPEIAREIDALMAGPVRPRPSVIVVGDDVVASFTPPPARPDPPPGFAAQ